MQREWLYLYTGPSGVYEPSSSSDTLTAVPQQHGSAFLVAFRKPHVRNPLMVGIITASVSARHHYLPVTAQLIGKVNAAILHWTIH